MFSLFNWFKRKYEIQNIGSLDINNPNHWIIQATAGQNIVTPDNALKISAVFACVRVLAETIASLPFIIYRKTGEDSRVKDENHYLYPMLHDIGPNQWQTAFEFWETAIGTVALRGNAYYFKVKNGANRIIGLIQMHPDNVELKVDFKDFRNPGLVYDYTSNSGEVYQIAFNNVWHLKGLSSDGFIGLSPLQAAAEAMNLSLNAESHGNTFFENGAQASGVATYPGKLNEEAFQRLRKSIGDKISGKNKFRVLLLEEGASYNQIGITNEDSQFLETRQFQVEDIARFFRVPNILINHPDKTSTYASAEQFMMSFVTHTIRPWLVRVEKSVKKNLLSVRDQKTHYGEFKVDGLLRGDTASRYTAYASAIQNTWMSPNEARKFENMPPRESGDVYENPNVAAKKPAAAEE